MRFLDSNIWLYALLPSNDPRHAKAVQRVALESKVTSTQVINEVCSNLIRKASFDDGQIEKLVRAFFVMTKVVPLDRKSLLQACTLRQRYSFSFWDSHLVACALLAGCTTFESEDMQDGLVVEGTLTISNPFR